jgi:hypothetical protein
MTAQPAAGKGGPKRPFWIAATVRRWITARPINR